MALVDRLGTVVGLDIRRMVGMMGLGDRGGIDMCDCCDIEEDLNIAESKLNQARDLAREILTLNPASGELGEGKARLLIELAEEVLRDS